MEKIIVLGCVLTFFELLQWFIINRILQDIRSVRQAYISLALKHNVQVLDISTYIKEDLQQKAMTRDLTEDEKTIFNKCHAMICKLTDEFRNYGLNTDVIT